MNPDDVILRESARKKRLIVEKRKLSFLESIKEQVDSSIAFFSKISKKSGDLDITISKFVKDFWKDLEEKKAFISVAIASTMEKIKNFSNPVSEMACLSGERKSKN